MRPDEKDKSDQIVKSDFAVVRWGLSYDQAREAVEALWAQTNCIGILVTDCGGPMLSGQELLRSLRVARPTVRLVCTGGRGDGQT